MIATGSAPGRSSAGDEVTAEQRRLPEHAERVGGEPGAARLLAAARDRR